MKIVVYYLSAENKGSLFVLNQFYHDAVACGKENIDWVFLVSIDSLQDTEHVKVVKLKKGNAIQRLAFESTKLAGIVNSFDPDLIVSLQNMPIRGCKQKQYVYLHQSIQYCPKRFSLLKSAEREMAIRQHFICGMYKKTLPRAAHIFVQTEWIKEATAKWLRRDKNDITIVPVTIDPDKFPIQPYVGQKSRTFFYPTRPEIYKNNDVIVRACAYLREWGITDYKVLLTIAPEEKDKVAALSEASKDLPVELIGDVPYQEMWAYYSQSILLFPSYVETCGLPLVEARAAGCRILASDFPFSHEALDGYPNVRYFAYDDAKGLAHMMKDYLENPVYIENIYSEKKVAHRSLCAEMIKKFEENR